MGVRESRIDHVVVEEQITRRGTAVLLLDRAVDRIALNLARPREQPVGVILPGRVVEEQPGRLVVEELFLDRIALPLDRPKQQTEGVRESSKDHVVVEELITSTGTSMILLVMAMDRIALHLDRLREQPVGVILSGRAVEEQPERLVVEDLFLDRIALPLDRPKQQPVVVEELITRTGKAVLLLDRAVDRIALNLARPREQPVGVILPDRVVEEQPGRLVVEELFLDRIAQPLDRPKQQPKGVRESSKDHVVVEELTTSTGTSMILFLNRIALPLDRPKQQPVGVVRITLSGAALTLVGRAVDRVEEQPEWLRESNRDHVVVEELITMPGRILNWNLVRRAVDRLRATLLLFLIHKAVDRTKEKPQGVRESNRDHVVVRKLITETARMDQDPGMVILITLFGS